MQQFVYCKHNISYCNDVWKKHIRHMGLAWWVYLKCKTITPEMQQLKRMSEFSFTPILAIFQQYRAGFTHCAQQLTRMVYGTICTIWMIQWKGCNYALHDLLYHSIVCLISIGYILHVFGCLQFKFACKEADWIKTNWTSRSVFTLVLTKKRIVLHIHPPPSYDVM